MSASSPVSLVCDGLEAKGKALLESVPDLEALLSAQWAQAQESWPSLTLSQESYLALLGAVLEKVDAPDKILRSLVSSDIYIVCACLEDLPGAHAAFESQYLSPLRGQLFKMGLDEQQIEDLVQTTRIKLFVAQHGAPAKIHDYVGRGRLGGLLQVMVTRAAIDLVRKSARENADEDLLQALPTDDSNPEMAALRAQCTREFRSGFESALKSLGAKERTLLRLRYIDKLGVDEVSVLYKVHRTSCSRWYSTIREDLLQSTRANLQERLAVSGQRFESLVGMVETQFDYSMERLLQTQAELTNDD